MLLDVLPVPNAGIPLDVLPLQYEEIYSIFTSAINVKEYIRIVYSIIWKDASGYFPISI